MSRRLLFGAVTVVLIVGLTLAAAVFSARELLPAMRMHDWVMRNPRPAEPQSQDEVLFKVPGIESDTFRAGLTKDRCWFLYNKTDGILYSREIPRDGTAKEAAETQIIANHNEHFAPGLAFLEDRPVVFSRNSNSKRSYFSVYQDGCWTNHELDTNARVMDWTIEPGKGTLLLILRDKNRGQRTLCRLLPQEAGKRDSWEVLVLPPMRGLAAVESIDGAIHLVFTDKDKCLCYARVETDAGSLASARLLTQVIHSSGEPAYELALRKVGGKLAIAFTIGREQQRVMYALAKVEQPTAGSNWHLHTAYRSLMFGFVEGFTEFDGRPLIHVGDNGELLLIARRPEPQRIDDWFYAPAATSSPFLSGACVLTEDGEIKTYYAGHSDESVHVLSYPLPFVPADSSRRYQQRYEDAFRINNLKQLEESAEYFRSMRN
ncbi:hypothetical protein IT575_02450 [bacterium]|nr:hypothetical protein [bacterium]